MKLSLSVKNPLQTVCDLVVLAVTKDWKDEISILDVQVIKKIREIAALEEFNGDKDQLLSFDNPLNQQVKIVLAGITNEKINNYKLQDIIGSLFSKLNSFSRKKAVLILNPQWHNLFQPSVLAQMVSEAILLSSYRFNKYKDEKNPDNQLKLKEVILSVHPAKLRAFEAGIALAELTGEATCYARDLVNEPASHMTPSFLAKCALDIGKKDKDVKVTIFDADDIDKLGMEAFLAVAQGSDHPPKFIRLEYNGVKISGHKITIIGKGITFDSGGLSLKPSSSMETMKCDMAGAAAVLGVFSIISVLRPKAHVTGLIAACENMPSGKALRPGDIVRALNGKTIEVLNTDAEGRLTLADVLSYAVRHEKSQYIVDLATLTGSIVAALGEEISGLFSNDAKLTELVKKCAREAGERVWQMPMPEDYNKLIKSKIADVRNTSLSKYGGAITAALFLQEFVDKTPWVHLDIAGPSFAEKTTPLCGTGGTGTGVRTILRLLNSI